MNNPIKTPQEKPFIFAKTISCPKCSKQVFKQESLVQVHGGILQDGKFGFEVVPIGFNFYCENCKTSISLQEAQEQLIPLINLSQQQETINQQDEKPKLK